MNAKINLVLTIWLVLVVHLVKGQHKEAGEVLVLDKHSLDLKMDELISKDFYQDSSELLRIVFTFKIDSLGEVHSAHIRKSKNLKLENYYTICMEVESKFILPFIFAKYRNEFEGRKYVFANYPYLSIRK